MGRAVQRRVEERVPRVSLPAGVYAVSQGLPEGPGDPLRSLPPRFSKRSMCRGLPSLVWGVQWAGLQPAGFSAPGWAPCPLNTLLFSRTSLWGWAGPLGALRGCHS